jgi:hypothetical protein
MALVDHTAIQPRTDPIILIEKLTKFPSDTQSQTAIE